MYLLLSCCLKNLQHRKYHTLFTELTNDQKYTHKDQYITMGYHDHYIIYKQGHNTMGK